MRIRYVEHFAVDPKPASASFLDLNGQRLHHYNSIEDIIVALETSSAATCKVHGKACAGISEEDGYASHRVPLCSLFCGEGLCPVASRGDLGKILRKLDVSSTPPDTKKNPSQNNHVEL